MGADADIRPEHIRTAIEERAFQLVYQPIVSLDGGEVAGVEALCRFRDGRSPVRWFEAAEAAGLAVDLDLAIIDMALADLSDLPPGFLSLNVSPSTVLDPRLCDALRAPGVPTERLVIEVTEHARVLNYPLARKALDALRREGVLVAVDDAGAGYASLHHVLRLRPDIIKIDHSITQHIDEDPARVALATALVIFGGEIGAVVVAEGVETKGELSALVAAGVSRAQGFALGRPQSLPLALPVDRPGLPPSPADMSAAAAEARAGQTAISAHQLLTPVGSIELALELLRKKTEAIGEDECAALVNTAQRQARYVGGALLGLARGLDEKTLIVLDEESNSAPTPHAEPADRSA